MFNLFKKKDTQSPTTQQPTISFSPDHPIFANIPIIEAKDLINSDIPNEIVAKLVAWFREHPNTAEHLYFRIFQNTNIKDYAEFRPAALRFQINKSIDLVIKQESFLNQPIAAVAFRPSEHPFPNLREISTARELWRRICQNDFAVCLMQTDIKHLVYQQVKVLKRITANIASLLTSIDAIPNNYIPIVNFESLNVVTDEIENKDSGCQTLQQRISTLQKSNATIYRDLSEISDKVPALDIVENGPLIVAMFLSVLESHRQFYDETNKCLSPEADCTSFLDYLYHPNCIAASVVQQFLVQKSPNAYFNLIEQLCTLFEVTDENSKALLNAICSNSMAPLFSPIFTESGDVHDIPFDIEKYFSIFITDDPTLILKSILDELSTPEEHAAQLLNVVNGLRCYTDSWKEIFKYVVEYTSETYLPPHLLEVRNLIVQQLM